MGTGNLFLRGRAVRRALTPEDAGPLLALAERPLLTAEEERALGRRIAAGRTAAAALANWRRVPPAIRRAWQEQAADGRRARDELALRNVRLAWYVAQRYDDCQGRMPLADLISEAMIGLLRAAERYDPERNVRYATYAAYWIRKYVSAAVQRAAHRTPIPLSALLVEEEDEEDALRAARGARRADADGDPLLEDLLARARRAEVATLLAQSDLDARERRVIMWRYFSSEDEARSPGAIARRLGVGQSRIQEIERAALAKLRATSQRCCGAAARRGGRDPEERDADGD